VVGARPLRRGGLWPAPPTDRRGRKVGAPCPDSTLAPPRLRSSGGAYAWACRPRACGAWLKPSSASLRLRSTPLAAGPQSGC